MGKKHLPAHQTNYNPFLGHYINTYIGFAIDKYIRFYSSSGGVVTGLLAYLLENHIVDAAIVVSDIPEKWHEFKPSIIENADDFLSEIKHIFGSRYVPIPLNVVLKELDKKPH